MKREILFRGQTVTGEFITGSLIVFGERTFIYPSNGSQEDYHFYGYEVIPETVGQFTGLTDKNGKMIFEGDILQVANNIIYQVMWTDGGTSNFEWYGGTFILWLNEETFFPFDEFAFGNGEVIGTIHDNPELLK